MDGAVQDCLRFHRIGGSTASTCTFRPSVIYGNFEDIVRLLVEQTFSQAVPIIYITLSLVSVE